MRHKNNLKFYREKAGMTQRELALIMGLNVPVKVKGGSPRISNYENGIRLPDMNLARAFAAAITSAGVLVTIEELFLTPQEALILKRPKQAARSAA